MKKKSVTINRPIGDLDVVINRQGFLNHYDKRVKEFTGENWVNGRGIRGLGRDSQTILNNKDQEHEIKILELKKFNIKIKNSLNDFDSRLYQQNKESVKLRTGQ